MQKAEIDIYSKVNEVFAKTVVTHKILNNSNKPIELEVFIDKYLDNNMFSSFEAQIGKSTKAKSKVIKAEKAEEKYTDTISSGNAAIYTTIDKYDKNKIIVHIGNIPPKEQLTFSSEFIQYTESANDSYEYELFRNVPIIRNYQGRNIENNIIKGTLEIKAKSKIKNINKKFLSDKLIIVEEKKDKDQKSFILKYKYGDISNKINIEDIFRHKKSMQNSFYIPTSKLLFDLESNNSVFYQNSIKNKDEQSFIFNYKIMENKDASKNKGKNQDDTKLNPALFIFLIDQSGSMSGSPIKVASKALLLFLQSLPAGSYYQIIGFGSSYKIYGKTPKEYNQKNIQESIEIVKYLKGDMGGTNIYDPLEYIYKSKMIYEKVLLPRNIFLLTDGEIDDKSRTLNLIENNSNEFSVYSIGIGNDFDKDLIKNAGIVGKGNYSFCKNIDGLNQVIVSNLNNICTSSIYNLEIKSNLDNINLYNTNNIDKVMKKNKVYRIGYITKEKLPEKKINFEIKYKENQKDFNQKCQMEPIELQPGEELSKLIMYKNLLSKDSEEEKIKLALKYQIFIEGTSLYTEIELSGKITQEMEHREMQYEKIENKKDLSPLLSPLDQKINEHEKNLDILEIKSQDLENEAKEKIKLGDREGAKSLLIKQKKIIDQMIQIEGALSMIEEQKMMLENTTAMKDVLSAIKQGNQALKSASKGMSVEDLECMEDNMESINPDREELNEFFKDYEDDHNDDYIDDKLNELENICAGKELKELPAPNKEEEELDLMQFLCCDSEPIKNKKEKEGAKKEKIIEEKKLEKKKEKKKINVEENLKLDLKKKEDVMKIINCQDFISGYWDINNETKNVKNKYEKEFKLLKNLKNIDDIIAMTIIIIFFINKEHKELLDELLLILKKARSYIQDKVGDSYENIIKKAGINK